MSSLAAASNASCPRCGGPFHCGAAESRCDCFELKLDEPLRQALTQRYDGCLCIACLRALQAEGAEVEAGKTCP